MIRAFYHELDGPDGITRRLTVKGHAGYAPAGQDIVCAGASILMQALVWMTAGSEEVDCAASDGPEGPRISVTASPSRKREDSERLDAALCAGETDLNFYNLSAQDPRLEYQLLSRDAVCAVLPAGHPAGKSAVQRGDSRELDLSSLTGETFLLQKRTQRQGQYLYELMRRQKVTPARVLETSNIRAAFALAVNGYGVAFLAEGLLRRLDQGQPFDAYRLTGGPSMDFVAAWRKGSYLPAFAQDFIRLMQEV